MHKVSASKGHHQANIYRYLKLLVHVVQLVNFMGSHLHSLLVSIIVVLYAPGRAVA